VKDGVNQCSYPHGEEGRKTLEEMNEGHRVQIQWGLDSLPDTSPSRIFDAGCGGGIFGRMALEKYPGSECDGLDISELSIEYAVSSNRDLIDEGRMRFQTGDVMSLPFPDGTFDLVVSNASYFFWPDPNKGFSEISRVLQKGGLVCLTAGAHYLEDPDPSMKAEFDMVNLLTDRELLELLDSVGFDAKCVPHSDGRICAYIGVKRRFRTSRACTAPFYHVQPGFWAP